jgi:hypothetical protein
MLLAFLAAASAQPVTEMPRRVAAEAPARVSVRILRPAVIRVDRLEPTEESVKRAASVRERDGTIHPASLIEYY